MFVLTLQWKRHIENYIPHEDWDTELHKDINTNNQVEGNTSYISAKANVLIMSGSHQRLQEQEILRQSEQGNRISKEQTSLKERE